MRFSLFSNSLLPTRKQRKFWLVPLLTQVLFKVLCKISKCKRTEITKVLQKQLNHLGGKFVTHFQCQFEVTKKKARINKSRLVYC